MGAKHVYMSGHSKYVALHEPSGHTTGRAVGHVFGVGQSSMARAQLLSEHGPKPAGHAGAGGQALVDSAQVTVSEHITKPGGQTRGDGQSAADARH